MASGASVALLPTRSGCLLTFFFELLGDTFKLSRSFHSHIGCRRDIKQQLDSHVIALIVIRCLEELSEGGLFSLMTIQRDDRRVPK